MINEAGLPSGGPAILRQTPSMGLHRMDMTQLRDDVVGRLSGWPFSVATLMLRVALAVPFFRSGLTKWDGLSVSAGAKYLFANEFKLHIFGNLYAYPFPNLLATLAAVGEVMLPILLVFGLLTRLSALGILAMTVVIQITVPEAWANFHLPWAAMAVALIVVGPGRFSLDCLLMPWHRGHPHAAPRSNRHAAANLPD